MRRKEKAVSLDDILKEHQKKKKSRFYLKLVQSNLPCYKGVPGEKFLCLDVNTVGSQMQVFIQDISEILFLQHEFLNDMY